MAASSADDSTRITIHTTAHMASWMGSHIRKLLLLVTHVEMLPRRKKNLPPHNGSFLESDISPPLCSKHFIAKFQVFVDHLDFPLTYASLVNNGAHLILIHPEIADELHLQCHPLKKPEIVSMAIKDSKKKKKMTLYHYVKFTVTFTDNVWTSKVIHALVAPGLCMPIILGLSLLIHNDIVTDNAEHSCVDKKTGYNFLNLSPVSPPPLPHMHTKEQIKFTKATKKEVLAELTEVCHKHMADKKLTFKKVKDIDVIAAIRDAIEVIALKEELKKHGDDIKKGFQPIFEPIPHVDDLP